MALLMAFVLGLHQDDAATGPRRLLCVVDVTTSAWGTGLGYTPGGDQAGVVGHVHHEDGADFLGDLGEALEIDVQAVGEAPATISLGLCSRALASIAS